MHLFSSKNFDRCSIGFSSFFFSGRKKKNLSKFTFLIRKNKICQVSFRSAAFLRESPFKFFFFVIRAVVVFIYFCYDGDFLSKK